MMNHAFFIRLRAICNELIVFLKRDLQDDHWADYCALSREARRVLLVITLSVLVVIFFIIWRYFFGHTLLTRYQGREKGFNQKIIELSQNIKERANFLESDAVILFQKQRALESSVKTIISEVQLMQLLESSLTDNQLILLKILPHKAQMQLRVPKRQNLRSKPLPLSQRTLLSYLQPISSDLLLANSHDVDMPLISMLEIRFNICGEYHALFSFLATIQTQLSASTTLLFLEQLTVGDNSERCIAESLDSKSFKHFELKLQFYDFLALELALGKALEKEEYQEVLPQVPRSLPALSEVLQAQIRSDKNDNLNLYESEEGQLLLRTLFQENKGEVTLDKKAYLSVEAKEKKRYWQVGETYQGLYLAGIIIRDQKPLAIIQKKNGVWETWQEGDNNVLIITPQYLELSLP